MRITGLHAKNYRTLENFRLSFPSFYSALCGRNDSGKTNIVRLIRSLMREEDPYYPISEEEVTLKEDFTKWIDTAPKERKISLGLDLLINKDSDTGLHEFVRTYLNLRQTKDNIKLTVNLVVSTEPNLKKVVVRTEDKKFSELKAQEVLKKLQSSRIVLFHISTEYRPRFYRGSITGSLRDLSEEYAQEMENMQKALDRGLKKIAKAQQKEIVDLLGRLDEKYKVGLTLPAYDFSYLPYILTLGDRKIDVSLEDWGSGTRNRTLILLTLFRAKQISDSTTSASKITPIIVIEEPESFLHPSAQAQFGRVLQDLAEEFKVQVITTTHSPYMLSQNDPQSNILLERLIKNNQLRQTKCVPTTGDRWMEPFGLALGVNNEEFAPWRDLFFSKKQSIILVEGDTDKEYFELLQSKEQGEERLFPDAEVFPYGGRDNLRKGVLLKFLKEKYRKIFVTYDLDSENHVKDTLNCLGFKKRKEYYPVGMDKAGKRNIEGLLPESILNNIHQSNSELVQQALSGTTSEKKIAKQSLKRKYLEEFKLKAAPGKGYYGNFYPIVRIINKSFNT